MRLGKVAGLTLLAMVAATPAHAIPTSDWVVFVEQSYSGLGIDDGPDWEDQLFRAAEEEPDIQRAVARFGRAIGVDPARADAYADVIVATTVLRERCADGPCRIAPGDAAYDRVMTPSLVEPSGELLWVVGRNLGAGGGPLGAPAFIAAVQDHPERVRVLTRMYEYSEDLALLVGLLLESPRDPALLRALLTADPSVGGGPDGWDGWQLAILEVAAARAAGLGAGHDEKAVYAQTVLARYFNLGLTAEGLRLYRALPEEVSVLLPLASPACGTDDRGLCAGRQTSEALTDELIAALALAGDRDDAMAVSTRATARLGDPSAWESRERRLAVLDAFERAAPAAGLFSLMVEGDGLNPDGHHSGMSGEGRMFLGYGPASRRLVADRLRQAGYASIARTLVDRPLYYRADRDGYEDLLARTEGFPVEVSERRRELAAAIEAAWSTAGPAPVPPRTAPASHPAGWIEARLPDGVPAWTPPAEPEAWSEEPPPAPPELAGLAVPSGAILRHQSVDGERYVLFQSSELDLPGEIPAYGVWLARTEAGAWTAPVYLGLQQHFPYVVTSESALPLVENGRLQIEVQVREIAPGSITFPPVGLSLARQEDGLFITRPLAEIYADTDSDGLTDIAEIRMGLDLHLADTDGDGRADGVDPAPLTAPSAPTSPARRTLALAIVQKLTGHDAGAIVISPRPPSEREPELEDLLGDMGASPPPPTPRSVILVSDDPALFADLDLPFRLMVYTPDQVRRLSEGGAPFYPPSVEIHSSLDGREHFVIWSASWVGGNFIARCPDDGGPCEIEEKSNWIT